MDMPDLKSPQGKKILIGAGVVIIGGIAYYRYRQNKNASTSTTTAQIDPATGYPYGSPQDAQALADQGSYQTPQDYGYGSGSGGGGGTGGGSSNNIVNNQQWYEAALGKVLGPRKAVADALSKYLAGEKVSPQEKAYVEQAIAAENYPPNGGANGYPPHIREGGAPGPDRQLKAPVLRVGAHHPQLGTVTLRWTGDPHASVYEVHSNTGRTWHTKTRSINVPDAHSYYVTATHAGVYIDSPPSNEVNVPNVNPHPHKDPHKKHHKTTSGRTL